jgi:hypothetical protein
MGSGTLLHENMESKFSTKHPSTVALTCTSHLGHLIFDSKSSTSHLRHLYLDTYIYPQSISHNLYIFTASTPYSTLLLLLRWEYDIWHSLVLYTFVAPLPCEPAGSDGISKRGVCSLLTHPTYKKDLLKSH